MGNEQKSYIELADESFSIVTADGTEHIAFDRIKRVAAYKADCLVVDLICCEIGVDCVGGEYLWTVNEEMPGFDRLMKRFELFPGFDSEWFQKVAWPAFATNRTLCFQRAEPGADKP